MSTNTTNALGSLAALRSLLEAFAIIDGIDEEETLIRVGAISTLRAAIVRERARLFKLLAPDHGREDGAGDALDKICAFVGAPEWEYPGQVVRDVAMALEQKEVQAGSPEHLKARDRLLILAVPLPVRLDCSGPFTRAEVEELGDPDSPLVAVAVAPTPEPSDKFEQGMVRRREQWCDHLGTLSKERHRAAHEAQKERKADGE